MEIVERVTERVTGLRGDRVGTLVLRRDLLRNEQFMEGFRFMNVLLGISLKACNDKDGAQGTIRNRGTFKQHFYKD